RYGVVGRRTPVGDHLLAQFVRWREELFRYFWQYNHDRGYSLPQIDEAIQRLLDRLIFIRTCEDRRIEEPRLLPLLRGREGGALEKDLWGLLLDLFREFDGTYDSRLFEHHLVDSLACDETPFRTLLEGLYFSAGPVRYQFDVIPADVLGRVYEQYLGFVAQTAKEVAKKEAAQAALPGFEPAPDRTIELVSKKLKRKQHGIYYTPQFVVDYIVEQTLERVLEERSLDEVRDLTVLDMACGSGSFLITAYERLLRHHAEAQQQPALPQEERLEVLTRNVYGVDLDAQAVEVAQLNLLLKALEEPGDLPNLNGNVKRGNSLVEGGAKELEPYFGEHWRTVARPLNWKRAFPQAIKRSGFDVIVGNPPYVRIQTLPDADKAYYKDHYQAATGNYDIYTLFVERGWQLLRPGGMLGFILPNKFFNARYGKGLRRLLSQEQAVWQIVDFGDAQVFEGATTYTCLLFLRKANNAKLHYALADAQIREGRVLVDAQLRKITARASTLGESPWSIAGERETRILDKLDSAGPRLGETTSGIYQGIRTSANDVYVLEQRGGRGDLIHLYSRALDQEVEMERALLKPFLRGEQIKRYRLAQPSQCVIVPYLVQGNQVRLVSEAEFEVKYPKTWEYLLANRQALEDRERGRMRHGEWYAYIYPKNLDKFSSAKILTPDIAPDAAYALDSAGEFYLVSGYGISLKPSEQYAYPYVLGLLNSQVLDFYLKQVSTKLRGGFYRYFTQFLERLPIRRINFDDPAQVAQHDAVVAHVEELLRLYARRGELPETDERSAVQAAIDAEEAA
ncbi:MAG: N-6 DNA methylase, partial [Chloroflexi bacterium]|nr:N-6 DNA methylase [Chloroflexota bacterium]